MAEVRIIARSPIVTFPRPNEPKVVNSITYQTIDLPPRTVFVDGEDPTDEAIKAAIREDIEKARTELSGPTTIEI